MYCFLYAERVLGCVGDDNAGMGDGRGVIVVSAGMWVMHVVHVMCLAQLTC